MMQHDAADPPLPAQTTSSPQPGMRRLCAAADVEEGEGLSVSLDGRALAVWRVEGAIFVTDDICSHGQASLTRDGMLDGFEIVCGLHQGSFDVRTGQAVAAPCIAPIRAYPVHLIGDGVHIDLAPPAP